MAEHLTTPLPDIPEVPRELERTPLVLNRRSPGWMMLLWLILTRKPFWVSRFMK